MAFNASVSTRRKEQEKIIENNHSKVRKERKIKSKINNQ